MLRVNRRKGMRLPVGSWKFQPPKNEIPGLKPHFLGAFFASLKAHASTGKPSRIRASTKSPVRARKPATSINPAADRSNHTLTPTAEIATR